MAAPTPKNSPDASLSTVTLTHGAFEEIHVSATPDDASADAAAQTRALYDAVLAKLEDPSTLHLVSERVFGALAVKETFLAERERVLVESGVDADGPVTCIEGHPVEGLALAGLQMVLVRRARGVEIAPVRRGTMTCGFAVQGPGFQRLFLSGMHGVSDSGAPGSPAEQAARMFERTHDVVTRAGFDYGHVVCTRIFLRRILDWYGEFNRVRTPYYAELGLSDPAGPWAIPASTGIQGKISETCEVFMDVWAHRRGAGDARPFTTLHNPLQNEATAYGSSFARAVSVELPGGRSVVVSGTASIDEAGRSVHVGDARGQARRTIANFEAILSTGGARPRDLSHAVWYCKDVAYAPVVRDEMRAAGWPAFPYVLVRADVCRPELLVEIDGTALIPA
ncbi:MAG TPA: RidA family protein [Planctomycetota bacterium]|nr:RidA family protein [Planctomycetota bacterium]